MGATHRVRIRHDSSILFILCHVNYHPSLVESCQEVIYLLGTLQLFHRLLFPRAHCFTLSLSDLPPEGSRWRRHTADSTRQEPGPEGGSSEGAHRHRAVWSTTRALHCLRRVSIATRSPEWFADLVVSCSLCIFSTAAAFADIFLLLLAFNEFYYRHGQNGKMAELSPCPSMHQWDFLWGPVKICSNVAARTWDDRWQLRVVVVTWHAFWQVCVHVDGKQKIVVPTKGKVKEISHSCWQHLWRWHRVCWNARKSDSTGRRLLMTARCQRYHTGMPHQQGKGRNIKAKQAFVAFKGAVENMWKRMKITQFNKWEIMPKFEILSRAIG